MPLIAPWMLRAFGGLCAFLLLAGPLASQSAEEGTESPLVEKLTLSGVESVSESELRESIATDATRCRSIVLTPLCIIPGVGGLFLEKSYLDREEFRQDELRTRVFYWRRGYRDVQASTSLEPTDDGVRATITVEEGPATRIRSLEVRQTQPVLSAEQIREVDFPAEGTPLDLVELDSATVRLQRALLNRGYADAEVRDTIRLVDSLGAAVEIIVEPKRRAVIGPLVIRGNEQVSERTIRRALDLDAGDLYRREEVLDAQRRLYRTELFRQALVEVPEQEDSTKQVILTLQEAPFRAVQAGVGFNTLDFFQTQAGYTRYNWLGDARRLDLRVTVGNLLAPQLHDTGIFDGAFQGLDQVDDAFLDPNWRVSAEVTQPFFLSARNALAVGTFAHRRTVPGIVIDRGYGASAAFTRRISENLPVSASYRFEVTTVEAGGVYYCVNFGVCRDATIEALRGSQTLSPFGLSGFWDQTNDPFSPTSGFTARVDLEHASELTLSDYRYNRATGEAVRYLELGGGVLAGRIRGGWVNPLASTAEAVGVSGTTDAILHPRKRFYAGGARSVRGYGENQLGPRILTIPSSSLTDPSNPNRRNPADTSQILPACTQATILDGTCNPNIAPSDEFQPRPLGGNTVFEANVEFRFPLVWLIGGAVFVDGAVVGDRNLNIPTGGRAAITPGFGFRYDSPAGPVRLDLGVKPTLKEELPVVTEIEAGGESRLVQLPTRKQFDPLEDSSGFLGQILSRLQLHFSIGQAF